MSVERESTDRFSTRSRRSAERGAVLVAGLFGVMVLLAFGALVVDLLRIERIARSLQRAADAASLAGTLQLKGDPYEYAEDTPATVSAWRKAKRAAVLALRSNIVAEGTNELAGGAKWLGQGTIDPWDLSYGGTDAGVGNLHFTIERGAWLYKEGEEGGIDIDGGKDGPFFVSLESDSGKCPEVCTVYNYQASNAVRVRVVLTGMRSFFPLAWAGTAQVSGISREATASKNPS